MAARKMGRDLYESLALLRAKPVKGFVEEPVVVDPKSSISEVIGVLTEADAYEAFIPLSNRVATINLRDILEYRDIASAKPSVIGKIVPPLSYGRNIGYAATMMSQYRMRALPIVERKRVVGQVSTKAILRIIKEAGGVKRILASDIMTPNPIMVRAEDKGSTARGIMIRHKLDHLPVVQDGKLAGIVTSEHMVRAKLPSEKIGRRSLGIDKIVRMDFPVIGIADRNVVASGVDDTLLSVTSLMMDATSTYSIVKLVEEVQGIITHRDIASLLEERVEEDIPAFIVGLPEDPFDAELAKSKFTSTVRLLRRISPEIEEARCNMKIRDRRGERRRYEVDINVITPYRRITYTNTGWDLAKIFDQVSDGLKKKLAHRRLGKKKRSPRRRTNYYTG